MDTIRLCDQTSSAPTTSPELGPKRELPDELIEFILETKGEPLRKRKRQQSPFDQTRSDEMDSAYGTVASDKPNLEHVVVNSSVLEFRFIGSKLARFETPLERHNIIPYINFREYVEIIDDRKTPVFHAPLSPGDGLDDVRVALLVHLESRKWAKTHGRLWTDCSLALFQRDQYDVLHIKFTIQWNITPSPNQVMQANNKSRALIEILRRYFPDPNALAVKSNWSPQDFYASVYSPKRSDDTAASLVVPGLETNLFPFQKRGVRWLLRREGVEWTNGVLGSSPSKDRKLPISFVETADANGRKCYVSHVFGVVTLKTGPFQEIEELKGGILAEEMGLGKTVEIISLILMHRRPKDNQIQLLDSYTSEWVRPTGATLIICPPSILQQWIAEINKHAPQLKVMHYEGVKATKETNFSSLIEEMCLSDVVVVSSHHVSIEVYFTPLLNPEKTLRRESKYPRPKSPLMMLSWWRCLIDEAQMFESGVSNAARVARLIPRVNAWCVTGTPVRKGVDDLLGLLIFLRLEPYASTKHIWSSLISYHKSYFQALFGHLALRHSKLSVRDELNLPAQKRYIITMPFTPIEEQHYQELFKQMCDECGLDLHGAPLSEEWDLDSVSDTMRKWLERLRQTALHPEVGGKNRRALGNRDSKVSTIGQVLEIMMDQADQAIRVEQRALLVLQLKRGQLFENSPRVTEALDIWSKTAKEASVVTDECRQQLRFEIAKSSTNREISHLAEQNDANDSGEDQDEPDTSSRLGVFRNRLRAALEVEHMAKFFQANAYFQIKSDEGMTEPDTPEFKELERLEIECYEMAKTLRREILHEIHHRADRLMKRISRRAANNSFVQIPEFLCGPIQGGLQNYKHGQQIDELASVLNAQAKVLDEWRAATIQFLLLPLVDEDDGLEITGDEYEESTKTQDKVMVYVQALRTIVADRHDIFTGQRNKLVEYEVAAAEKLASSGQGPFPEKTVELLRIRQQLKPKSGSIRGVIAELRATAASLRPEALNGSSRASSQLTVVEEQLAIVQEQYSLQMKAISACEKEVDILANVMNTRLEYYRQLQELSDSLAPYEGPNDERVLAKMEQEELAIVNRRTAAQSKRRYLEFLATNMKDHRICVICRDVIEIGALTVCGHSYCKECISMWWNLLARKIDNFCPLVLGYQFYSLQIKVGRSVCSRTPKALGSTRNIVSNINSLLVAHKTCPMCNRKIARGDLFTYKPQILSIQADEIYESSADRPLPPTAPRKSAIYGELSKSKLAEIKSIELNGPSFSTKVDTLARHLVFLRSSDPGAKSIIYSQFRDFLDVLAQAFEVFRIGFSSIDKPNGIEKFKQDPGVECFLLHAKAHSSGLNLVSASHVFLCEPLLNTALELQAIARVDRIGQTQETNVWLYLIEGSTEESIHQLSVRRRMEHIDRRCDQGKGKGKAHSEEQFLSDNLEEANSTELQQASLTALLAKGGKSGELVKKEDLLECLFGGKQKAVNQYADHNDLGLNLYVGRHLMADG